MNKNNFSSFLDLVSFDREAVTINREVVKLESEVLALSGNIDNLQKNFNIISERLHELRKDASSKELEIKELNQLEAEEKKRGESVTNTKEYKAIQEEVDNVKKLQQLAEFRLLEIWNKLEAVQKENDLKRAELDAKIKELQGSIDERKQKIGQLKNSLEEHTSKRVAKEEGIPKDWLDKYEIMRKDVVDPVVPVVQGVCSSCFYTVPHQVIMDLKHNKLLQCRNCYRFIYFSEEKV